MNKVFRGRVRRIRDRVCAAMRKSSRLAVDRQHLSVGLAVRAAMQLWSDELTQDFLQIAATMQPRHPADIKDNTTRAQLILWDAACRLAMHDPEWQVSGSGSRFVVRVGRMTQDLTYSQLRGAFDRTATLIERAREFRRQRIAKIKVR